MAGLADLVAAAWGRPVVSVARLGGGDISTVVRATLTDGSTAVAKVDPTAPTGFFAREAAGLDWLREGGGAPVPEVRAVSETCLVLEDVPAGPPSAAAAERFGRALAATHAAGAPAFGWDGPAGWIGTLPLPAGPWAGWPQLWVEGRVAPYLRMARDRGALSDADTAAIEEVCDRIDELAGDPESPARVHGDLWGGNVHWGADGHGWIIDPAAHGGHRETDLAMLALFGLPYLDRVVAAYAEVSPLAPGWRERVPLHQLHPLLVHAVLFGGGYGGQAGRAARAALG